MTWSKLLTGCACLCALAACDKPKWAESPAPSGTAQTAPAPAPAAPAAPITQDPLPAYPAWAAGMIGQPVAKLSAGLAVCIGNLDVVTQRYAGPHPGAKVIGWGWSPQQNKIVDRVVLVDQTAKVVGAGDGGQPRPDVPANNPRVRSPNAGWQAVTGLTTGPVDAFGVIEGQGLCPLGHIDL